MKTKSFRFLWFGQMLANAGDVFYIVGMIASIYSMTGSSLVVAVFPFTSLMAQFISGFIAPLLIDKYPLKKLLVYSQLGKTILLFVLGVYYYLEVSSMQMGVVFVLVFVISFLDGWAAPARNAMLPRLVSPSELVKANSFVSVLDQSVQLGGWAFGGLLVSFLGGNKVILITFALFIISTIMMSNIRDHQQEDIDRSENRPSSKWQSLKEGWSLIWETDSLRKLHIIFFLESIAGTVWIAAVLYVYVEEQLQMGEAWWGYINASFFVGLLLGGIIGMKKSDFVEKHMGAMIFSMGMMVSVSTLFFGLNTIPWLALVLSTIFGISEQLKGIAMQTALQKSIGVGHLPKIYSAQGAQIALTFGVASLAIGYITDVTHVTISFIIAASILFVAALYSFVYRESFPSHPNREVQKIS